MNYKEQFRKQTGENAVLLDGAGVRCVDRPNPNYVIWLEDKLKNIEQRLEASPLDAVVINQEL